MPHSFTDSWRLHGRHAGFRNRPGKPWLVSRQCDRVAGPPDHVTEPTPQPAIEQGRQNAEGSSDHPPPCSAKNARGRELSADCKLAEIKGDVGDLLHRQPRRGAEL